MSQLGKIVSRKHHPEVFIAVVVLFTACCRTSQTGRTEATTAPATTRPHHGALSGRRQGSAQRPGHKEAFVPWAIPQTVVFDTIELAGRPEPRVAVKGQVRTVPGLCFVRRDTMDHHWVRHGSLWKKDRVVAGIVIDQRLTTEQAVALIRDHAATIESVTWFVSRRAWDARILKALASIHSKSMCMLLDHHAVSLRPLKVLGDKLYALWIQARARRGTTPYDEELEASGWPTVADLPPLSRLRLFGTDRSGSCYLPQGSKTPAGRHQALCRSGELMRNGPATTNVPSKIRPSWVREIIATSVLNPVLLKAVAAMSHIWRLVLDGPASRIIWSLPNPSQLREAFLSRTDIRTVVKMIKSAPQLRMLSLWIGGKTATLATASPPSDATVFHNLPHSIGALALVGNRWLELAGHSLGRLTGLRALFVRGSAKNLHTIGPARLRGLRLLMIQVGEPGSPPSRTMDSPFEGGVYAPDNKQGPIDVDAKTLAPFAQSPLVALFVKGRHCSNDIGPILARFTHLEHLDLSLCNGLDASILPFIARLHNLRVLDLAGKKLTSSDIAVLTGLRKLKVLGLGHNRLDDAAATWITRFRSLRQLYVGFNPGLTARFVERLAAIHRLEVLIVSRIGENRKLPILSRRAIHALASMRGLSRLGIAGWKLDFKGLAALVRMPQIERLEVDLHHPKPEWADRLTVSPSLSEFWFGIISKDGSDSDGRQKLKKRMMQRFSWLTVESDSTPVYTDCPGMCSLFSRISFGQ